MIAQATPRKTLTDCTIMRTECQLNRIVCGDFNRPGINWDDMTSDKHGERLLECSIDLFLIQ